MKKQLLMMNEHVTPFVGGNLTAFALETDHYLTSAIGA